MAKALQVSSATGTTVMVRVRDAIADIAELRAHEDLAGYKQTILTAVQQVDDAVASYGAEQDRLKNLDRARGIVVAP